MRRRLFPSTVPQSAASSEAYFELVFFSNPWADLDLQSLVFFLLLIRRPPISTLFPYTTLFRSIPLAFPFLKLHSNFKGALMSQIEQIAAFTKRVNTQYLAASDRERLKHNFLDTLGCAIGALRSEEHTSELQSRRDLVCRLLLEK